MKKLLLILLVAIVLSPIAFALLFKRIPPATIGVKQVRWFGSGIVSQDFETGVHLGVAGYHLWHYLPQRTMFLHFTGAERFRSELDRSEPPLEIRTKDNNVVEIEVSVPYRIKDGEAHLIVQKRYKVDYRDRVKDTVLDVLRSELSELSSEDLQSSEKRLVQVEAILPRLNVKLAEFHVSAEAILVRRIGFQQEYEQKLQEKQYLRQLANLDEALTAQANEEKNVNLFERQIVAAGKALTEDWEKKLQEKRSEYQVIIATIDSEAELYARRTRAEGEKDRDIAEANGKLAVERATALRDELRNQALSSEGGRILLALEAAHNLDVPTVTLNSDDPAVPMMLDLAALTRLLVGEPAGD